MANQSPAGPCPDCKRRRIIRHPELDRLCVAHIDCDAFYAAVEKRDDPALKDRPVIIGGGKRGVVSTACYIARIRGVKSAMPMFKALAACPNAVAPKHAEIRERGPRSPPTHAGDDPARGTALP